MEHSKGRRSLGAAAEPPVDGALLALAELRDDVVLLLSVRTFKTFVVVIKGAFERAILLLRFVAGSDWCLHGRFQCCVLSMAAIGDLKKMGKL